MLGVLCLQTRSSTIDLFIEVWVLNVYTLPKLNVLCATFVIVYLDVLLMLGCIKWIFNLFVSCALNLVKRLNRHGVIICYLTFLHLSGKIREFVRLTIMKFFENSHVWTVKLMLQLLLLCLSFTFRRTIEVVFDRRHLLQMVLTFPTSTLLSSSFSFS